MAATTTASPNDAIKRLLPWLVAVAFFMQSLDTTILNTAVPAIARAMDVAPLSVKSVLASYTLSLAVFMPVSGWMADRFGTRRVFATAIGLFTVGSVLCGLSTSLEMLVACRILQGAGGAMMMPVGRMTLARTYDKADLVPVMSFVAIPGLIGPMVGPVAGGLIVSYLNWRGVFYVNVPVGLLGVYFVYRHLPDYREQQTHPLDVVDLVLFGGGIALLSYVLEVFGEHSLSQAEMLGLLALAAALLAGYGIHTTSAASAARYEQILGHATDIIYRTDDTGHVTYCNPIALRLMRYSESEMMGIHFLVLVRPDSRRRIGRFYLRQFVERIPTTYCEVPAIAKDGTELWLGHNVQLIVENGRTIGFAAVARDITELKRVEDERRLLAAIVESSEDAIISETLDGTILSWNRGAEHVYGYTAEEAIGMPVATLLCSDPTETLRLLERVKDGQRIADYEATRRRKDGTPVAVSLKLSPVRDTEGVVTGASAIARDVTQRRLVEQALRDSEERFRTITASAQDGIVMMDADGRVAFWNRAAETIFGYSEGAVLGRDLHELVAPATFREAAARGLEAFWLTGEGAAIGKTREVVGRRNGGDEIPIELSLAPIHLDGRWHAVGIVRDITERKRVEMQLREARETAEAASRAKSDFLANMSHEIRTPMNGIIGMTDLALDTTLEPDQREYLEMVKVSADSLMSVINDILDFSKIEAGKLELDPVEFNLPNVLGDVMKVQALCAHQKGLELTWRVLPDVPENLVGDPGRLRQILVNLVGNAIKFTPQGEVAVEVEQASASPPGDRPPAAGTGLSRSEPPSACPRTELRFTVRDTGIGVAAEKQRGIFEAFEQADGSTTRKYGGTGLGLTIARRLVNLMEGDIELDSAVGHGSSFRFTACFGIAAAAPAIRTPAMLRDLPVLVVDDNVTNRRILEETVLRWGDAPRRGREWRRRARGPGRRGTGRSRLRPGIARRGDARDGRIHACRPDCAERPARPTGAHHDDLRRSGRRWRTV